ncbi:MAG: GspMb/PilO family protein [Dissulfurispiraceae bacterium]|jgi:Tfp pilus assembly protein PilO
MSRDRLKIIGFYVLAALIIARVVITPLQHSLRDKKALLKEYEDTYKMRMFSVEKYKAQENEKNKERSPVDEAFLKSLYGADVIYTALQSDVVEKISALAEKQGLTITTFEFSEPTSLKAISEVPVVIRLNGPQKGILALLREMEKDNMKLVIRRFEDTKNGPYTAQCSMNISAFRLEK